MNRKIKIILALLIGLCIAILSNQVYAASASISAGKTNLEPGQSTTITASISATEAWNLKVTASGGTLSGTTSDADAAGSEVSKNVISANFTASSEGTYTIILSGQVTGSDLIKQNVSKSIKITVAKPVVIPPATDNDTTEKPSTPPATDNNTNEKPSAPPVTDNNTSTTPNTPTEPSTPTAPETTTPTKSSNANLSNLGIRPNDFSGFRAATTSYSVSVPNNVASIEVYASKGHSAQTITGTGTKSLNEGSNIFEVKVTAEDGTTKTYKITVVRLAKESEPTPDVDNSPVTKVALTSLNIKDVIINEPFNPETLEYTANLTLDIEKLEIIAEANILDAKVEIQGADELKEGENIIKIIVTSADGKDVKEYTIKVTKTNSEAVVENAEDNNEIATISGITDNDNNLPMDTNTIILLAVIGASILGITLLIIVLIIKNKKNEEDAIDFVGDVSTAKSIRNEKDTFEKINNANLETAEETSAFAHKKRGKHF